MHKWFTLVEMIISITILSILTTLGFLGMAGYIESAKNTVRIEDIGKIITIVESETISGITLLAFTSWWQEVWGASIWWTGAIIGINYKAGDILPSVLKIIAPDFEDPRGDIYKIGVTTKNTWKYELSSIIVWNNQDIARVVWIYSPRIQKPILWIGKAWTKKFTLSLPEDTAKFYTQDVVTGTGVTSGTTIMMISSDGMRITLSNTLTVDITSLELAVDETQGLILWKNGGVTPVVEGGLITPY